MSSPRAVLVDDDPQQLLEASEAIREAGFDLQTFTDAKSMLDFLDGEHQFIDLFVLDRKLPMKDGETKSDELGDALFERVKSEYPDARILVFSGYTDFDHAQALMEGVGFLFDQGGVQINRVTVMKKSQFDRFERHLAELRAVLRAFEMIEVIPESALDMVEKRVLRRVGYFYGGTALRARELAGGLTSAKVWMCEITTPNGPIGTVVAKQGKTFPAPGGLQDLLPREYIARRVETISGLMDGKVISILQIAGQTPVPLMDLIGTDDLLASEQMDKLAARLDSVERSPQTSLQLAQIVSQIEPWEDVVRRLEQFGIPAPPGDLWVTTSSVMTHGDLHAGNVLICENDPVLIDSDGNLFAAALVDPLTMLMSILAHPHSKLAIEKWPTPEQIESDFGESGFGAESAAPVWFATLHRWIDARSSSPREFWSVALAYAGRQLQFDDVLANEVVRERVIAIGAKASAFLRDN